MAAFQQIGVDVTAVLAFFRFKRTENKEQRSRNITSLATVASGTEALQMLFKCVCTAYVHISHRP